MKRFAHLLFCVPFITCMSQGMQASSRVIDLKHGDKESKATVFMRSDSIRFTGKSHNSVGINFLIECDTAAFKKEKRVEYEFPETMEKGLRGGDDSTVTYILRPRKRGTHVVYTVVNYRGDEESRTKHVIIVK